MRLSLKILYPLGTCASFVPLSLLSASISTSLTNTLCCYPFDCSLSPALTKLILGLVYLAIFQVGTLWWPYSYLTTTEFEVIYSYKTSFIYIYIRTSCVYMGRVRMRCIYSIYIYIYDVYIRTSSCIYAM